MKYLKTYEEQNNLDLFDAVRNKNLIKVKELIKFGVNLDLQDNKGFTALIVASFYNYIKITKELINAGADLDLQDNDGYTALIYASDTNNIEIVKELIKANANWNIKDSANKDFLDYLKSKFKKEIINEFPEKYKFYKDVKKYNI